MASELTVPQNMTVNIMAIPEMNLTVTKRKTGKQQSGAKLDVGSGIFAMEGGVELDDSRTKSGWMPDPAALRDFCISMMQQELRAELDIRTMPPVDGGEAGHATAGAGHGCTCTADCGGLPAQLTLIQLIGHLSGWVVSGPCIVYQDTCVDSNYPISIAFFSNVECSLGDASTTASSNRNIIFGGVLGVLQLVVAVAITYSQWKMEDTKSSVTTISKHTLKFVSWLSSCSSI